MKIFRIGAVVAALLSISTSAGATGWNWPASPLKEVYVDCDVGQSLQDAVDRASWTARPYTIYVTGTCAENITISRSRLEINGGGEAQISGQIRNFGAGITLRDLTITGPGEGLRASGGRTRLLDVHFVNNDGHGISATGSAIVSMRGGSVDGSSGAGIDSQSSVLNLRDVLIMSNMGNGIHALMSQITITGATQVFSNDVHGIDANLHSSVLIDGPVVITNNDIFGIRVEYASGLLTFGPIEIYGNGEFDAICGDSESSAVFTDSQPGTILCSDYDW
jgi:hypothetical protein